MARLRLGVALLVPSPLDTEVDGLRRALDDGALGRIPAHITLVPPVNVRAGDLDQAVDVVRAAAAATRPFAVSLGPPTTFMPDSPVVYLPVTAGDLEVRAVHDKVFRPPLARELARPFVPHVTVADEAPAERIAAAVTAMAGYRAEVRFDRAHLLQETPGRVWVPIADAAFAVPAVVGRGGLPLEMSRTEQPDPVAAAFLESLRRHVTITARRDGTVVGVLSGWVTTDDRCVSELWAGPEEEALGTADHLRAAFESWAAEE